jgi:archaemetzincin
MSSPGCVGIVPMGTIPPVVPKVIAAHISGFLNLESRVLHPLNEPHYALDDRRLQFDAGTILETLEARSFESVDKIVAVLNVDLFLPVFSHVFGEARQRGRVALVSLCRLTEEPIENGKFSPTALERAAKVALHELGHLYGLVHCENYPCLMHFSGSLEELDRMGLNLCPYCSQYFRDATGYQNRA